MAAHGGIAPDMDVGRADLRACGGRCLDGGSGEGCDAAWEDRTLGIEVDCPSAATGVPGSRCTEGDDGIGERALD